jgi:hypothetical protein
MILMKKHILWALALLFLALTACEPAPFVDPNVDQSNTYPAFVRFDDEDPVSVALTDTSGATVSFTVEIPSLVYPDTEVQWEVTGAFATSGTVIVPAGMVEGDFMVEVPSTALAAGETEGTATIALVSANNGVVIGRGTNALGDDIDPTALVLNLSK